MMLTKALHTNCNTNKEMREDKNDVMTFFYEYENAFLLYNVTEMGRENCFYFSSKLQ